MNNLKISGLVLVVTTLIGYFLSENKANPLITNTLLVISTVSSIFFIFLLVKGFFSKKNN